MLLAIDLGLKCGLAVYDADGILVSYRSTRFHDRSALKKASWRVLKEIDGLTHLVVEGDRMLADVWEKVAAKQSITFTRVAPETWRAAILYDREQRDGKTAKRSAIVYATSLIENDGAPLPVTRLDDDVAEAILIGRWAVAELGWRSDPL